MSQSATSPDGIHIQRVEERIIRSPLAFADIIRRQAHPWKFALSRLLRAAHVSQRVIFDVAPGIRLRLYPSSASEMYWMQRDARAFDHQVLDTYIKPGMMVVDVGANIGALTVHASRLTGPTGRVIAFEAHPTTFRYLTGNISLNACTNVDARNVAVGAEPGSAYFSDFTQDDINHVVDQPGTSHYDPIYGRPRSRGVEVRVGTLDKVVYGKRVDFLKIDVEGYEKFVLQGGTATLATAECVYIESFEREFAKYGYHNRDVLELLQQAGLSIFRYDGREWKLIGSDHVSETVENLLALRDPSLAQQWSGSLQTRLAIARS